jgi:Dolichyl-phosphate-mannose-protein mannosyltransferase
MILRFLVSNTNRWPKWFFIALLIKGAFFAIMLHLSFSDEIEDFWGSTTGDTFSYIDPAENLLAGGSYNIDNRTPGYTACYFLLRLLFDKPTACNLLIFIQLLVASVSVVCLATLAREWFKSNVAFYATFYAYIFSSLANVYDHYLLTESFSASSVVFWVYFLHKFEQTHSYKYLLISGAFLTFVFFLKPAHAPMLALPSLIWGVYFLQNKLSFKKLFQHSLVFLVPFLAIDSAWTVRNYFYYDGAFVPISKLTSYAGNWPPNYFEMADFTAAWGGDINFGLPKNDIRWIMGFENNQYLQSWFVEEQLRPVPSYAHTSLFNADSLLWIRQESQRALYDTMPETERKQRQEIVRQKLVAYTSSIKHENPFIYYIWAPLRIAYKFFVGTSGNHFLEDKIISPLARKLLFGYHLVLLLTGSLGMAWLCFSQMQHFNLQSIAWLSGLFVFGIFCVLLRHAETRYLVPNWPFWALCTGYLTTKISMFREFF